MATTKSVELSQLGSIVSVTNGQAVFSGDVVVGGDILTTGNTIAITADNLTIDDLNITLANGSANSSVADGAGITIDGAGATLTYVASGDNWAMNKDLVVGPFDFDIATDRLTITNNTNTGGIDIVGNNGRIYFSGLRAIEGSATGNLSIGEGFSVLSLQPSVISATNGKITNVSYLGIGTSDPLVSLHIGDGTSDEYIVLDKGSSSTSAILFRNAGNNKVKLQVNAEEELEIHTNNTLKAKFSEAGTFYNYNNQPSVRPSLLLDFAKTKKLDSNITFYRDSIATYYDSKGVLRYSNNNQPRFDHNPITGESKGLLIEEQRTNTCPVTVGSYAFTVNGCNDIPNAAEAPDGTFSAVFGQAQGGVARHEINLIYDSTPSATHAHSVYVKAAGAVTHVSMSQAGGTNRANFDIINGVKTSGITTSGIESVGNGWFRIWLIAVYGGTGSSSTIYLSPGIGATTDSVYTNLNGDGLNGLYVWGGQTEMADDITSYIPAFESFRSRSTPATYYDKDGVLRTAPANEPRYGYKYNGREWVPTGLIREIASTNLLYNGTRSTDVYGDYLSYEAIWTVTDSSTNVTAPDGSRFTTKGVTGTTGNTFYWATGHPVTYVDGLYYTHSAWVRTAAGQGTRPIRITCYPQQGLDQTHSGGFKEVDANEEWTRYSITFQYNSALGKPYVGFATPTVSSTYYFWGWQVEQNGYATSYISVPAGLSTRTRGEDIVSSYSASRAKDTAYIDNIMSSDWYDVTKGTIYTEADANIVDDAVVVGINDGTARGLRNWWITSDTQVRSSFYDGDSYSGVHYWNSIDPLASHKMATAYSVEDSIYASSLDGATAQVATNWNEASTTPSYMFIGSETTTGRPYNGTIKRIAYYNDTLSADELQALTEND